MTSIEKTNVVHFALDVGEQLLTSGGEVGRAEDTVSRICMAYDAVRVDAFAIASAIMVTVTWEDGTSISEGRRVRSPKKNMRRLERLNALSRKVCYEHFPLTEAKAEYTKIMQKDRFSIGRELLGAIVVALTCTLFFGGTWNDALIAPLVGVSIVFTQILSSKIGGNRMLSQMMSAFIASSIAIFGVALNVGSSVEQIMIGCVMILIPGIAFTHAVENLITGDTLSGLLSSCEAIFVALALAFGFAVSMLMFGGFLPEIPSQGIAIAGSMTAVVQIVTAGGMAIGFALLFGLHGKELAVVGVGSALTWSIYLGMFALTSGNIAVSTFVAAVFGSLAAIWSSQLLKAPKTVFLFPLLVSLVPGSDLYRTMQAALEWNTDGIKTAGKNTVTFAFAIAFGIIVSVVYQQANMKIKARILEKRRAAKRK